MSGMERAISPDTEAYYQQSFAGEHELLKQIRAELIGGKNEIKFQIPENLSFEFNPKISQVYLTLFQPGIKKIRWGSRRRDLATTLQRIVEKLKTNPRFQEFELNNPQKCRILFEVVVEQYECNIRNLTTMAFNKDRFEPGVTGLKYSYKDVLRYFMPTDSITHSIMSINQLLNFLSKQTGIAKRTNSIKERAHLMRREPIQFELLKSAAFITEGEQSIPLYRGYPARNPFSSKNMYSSMLASMDWLLANMYDDGRFLYYYDPYKDTVVDEMHPKMTDPLYNNILRHCGGTITLLRGYEHTQQEKYLKGAQKSLDFLVSTFREHEYQGRYACFPFFNKKSKLGGAGVGLVAMMQYYIMSGDKQYRHLIDGLVNHILSRVDEEGEMIGYYIHPLYNNGNPLVNLSVEMKKALFSFYYPGEALLGLALYYRHMDGVDLEIKQEVYDKSRQALDFLVHVRPERYQELFLSLPADAWLMQAIEEWVKVDGFKKQSYIDFVFNDAKQMIEHMYHEENAPSFDYIGGFYYEYGDHVYHDASRCEGLIAAYYLARYLGESEQADFIMQNMQKSAKGLMLTRHTSASTYAHLYPEKSIDSFRFKLTRQWVRVDSVQHLACFYARLYKVM